MADVRSPHSLPQPGAVPVSSIPRGENEDGSIEQPVLTGLSSEAVIEPPPANGQAADSASVEAALETHQMADSVLSEPANPAKSKSSGVSGKSGVGKSNGGPPSPLVKKMMNAGTFVPRALKSPQSKAGTASKSPLPSSSASASPIKKAASSPSASSSKPAMVPKIASSISSSLFGSNANKRASLAPKVAIAPPAPTTKPSLSSSTSAKPSTSSANAPARASAVSPTGAAARPRASVTDGIKKPPASGRQSLSAQPKPSPPSAKPAAVQKPSRATPSISSIKEVKDDGKALEELQSTLSEVSGSLAAKTEAVAGLEVQIGTLNASLESAIAESTAQRLVVGRLEKANAASETGLKETTGALEKLQFDYKETTSNLQAAQLELETTKATAALQTGLAQSLQSRVDELEAEIQASKEQLTILQEANEAAAVAAAAAAIEHDALVKVKADLDAIHAETIALEAAHRETLQAIALKAAEVQTQSARVDELQSEVNELKKEKEDNANKISELEVEVLELKETQEATEDDRLKALQRIKELGDQLSKAIAATEQALKLAAAKEAEGVRVVEELKAKHEGDLKTAADAQAAVLVQIETLQLQLATTQAAHEQARLSAEAAAEAHGQKVKELEGSHADKQHELSEEIKRIAVELKGQEAQYAAQVDTVKLEHETLLQAAFERAKLEAGTAHSIELQALRAESEATTQQLVSVHHSEVATLKAEHQAELDERIKALGKQLDHKHLDLKATQDDLAKAKAALESSQSESAKIQAQLEEARTAAQAAAETTPKYLATISRLSEELASTKNDLASLTDILNLTKRSLEEISRNHVTELEEAAKGRAEEVTRLRASHDEDVAMLATQKSDLQLRLSDLESELATVKATAAAEAAAASAPKTNGNTISHPLSPAITKEELQQLHEAHNLKLHDVQAEHDREIRALQEELETALAKADELQQDVSRRVMEIQYLEQEQEENQDQITRLKEDVDRLTEPLKAKDQPGAE